MRSLLTSVTNFGSDFTSSLPPMRFSYQVKPFSFGPDTDWTGLYSQGDTSSSWNSIKAIDGNQDYNLTIADIDGDGLPDRVMRPLASPFNKFYSQRNTGTGFPSGSNPVWSPVQSQGQTDSGWNSPTALDSSATTR